MVAEATIRIHADFTHEDLTFLSDSFKQQTAKGDLLKHTAEGKILQIKALPPCEIPGCDCKDNRLEEIKKVEEAIKDIETTMRLVGILHAAVDKALAQHGSSYMSSLKSKGTSNN